MIQTENKQPIKEISYQDIYALYDVWEQLQWTTWHHTEIPGKMELVDFGVHNITSHNGGRTAGMWASGPR